jgi:hypothetical protein
MGIAGLSTAKTIFWKRSGLLLRVQQLLNCASKLRGFEGTRTRPSIAPGHSGNIGDDCRRNDCAVRCVAVCPLCRESDTRYEGKRVSYGQHAEKPLQSRTMLVPGEDVQTSTPVDMLRAGGSTHSTGAAASCTHGPTRTRARSRQCARETRNLGV